MKKAIRFLGALSISAGVAVLLSIPSAASPRPETPGAAGTWVENPLPSVIEPSPTPTPEPRRQPRTEPPKPKPARSAAKPRPTTAKSPRPTTKPTATPRTIRLAPVTAIASQATIDRGKLVTWMTRPTCLLAGHDTMGWSWLDNIATGTIVKVTTGPCSGTYKVVGHKWQSVKGGPVPSWMSNYDLVLQTCTGSSGMGFSIANRLW